MYLDKWGGGGTPPRAEPGGLPRRPTHAEHLRAVYPPTSLYHAQVTPKQDPGTPGPDEAVQEERLRQRKQWTTNVSKVRDMEYRRLHTPVEGRDVFDTGKGGDVPDFSRGCSNPIQIHLFAGNKLSLGSGAEKIVSTSFVVRCGRPTCPECSTNRRRMWAARAFAEVEAAKRSWFLTMTARPETMTKWFSEAGLVYFPGVGHSLSSADYDRVVKAAYRDIQLWKKRVAKELRGLRFLFTVEKHTGKRAKTVWGKAGLGDYFGLPHFHGLVHETGSPVSYAQLKKASRPIGFFEAKLVEKDDPDWVWYLCKYISKDNGSRNLWPSFRYGRLTNGDIGLGAEEL